MFKSVAPTLTRTRFAPSPSGHLHVGGARTALFCWAFARQHGGKFILRIEDTDQKRSSGAASLGFLKDLKWLGIDWDEGPQFENCGGGEAAPYFQSQRLDIYRHFAQKLIDDGKAYRAFETPDELEAARAKARKQNRQYRYDRAGAKLDADTINRFLAEGRPHVVRFRVPDDRAVIVNDQVLGEVRTAPGEIDDFVIIKADGYPTYHFAVVVDDELMGVTHVIRAQEHLNNTPKHVLLQEALGFRQPVFAHMSIICNPDGSKMSKRDKDKRLRAAVKERQITTSPIADGAPIVPAETWSWWLAGSEHQLDLELAERLAAHLNVELPEINVDDFRKMGYLPEVLVNYLALLGWSPGNDVEKFDAAFIIQNFNLARVQKSPAKFDRDKLLAFNLDALQAMTPEAFEARLRDHGREFHPEFRPLLDDNERFAQFASINRARSKTLDAPYRSCRFLIVADDAIVYEDSKAVQKAMQHGQPNGYEHLKQLLPRLRSLDTWTTHAIEEIVKGYVAKTGAKLNDVAQPLRIAVTGGTVSPAIFETLTILGQPATLARIQRCMTLRPAVVKTS